MIAFIRGGDQFLDFAVRDLCQNAIAFRDGQQDGVQHFIQALDDFAVRPFELVSAAALVEAALPGGFHQPQDFLCYAAQLRIFGFSFAVQPDRLFPTLFQ